MRYSELKEWYKTAELPHSAGNTFKYLYDIEYTLSSYFKLCDELLVDYEKNKDMLLTYKERIMEIKHIIENYPDTHDMKIEEWGEWKQFQEPI